MFGKYLINMCTLLNFSISNDTCNDDSHGSYTFVAENECSVVDDFIMSNDV